MKAPTKRHSRLKRARYQALFAAGIISLLAIFNVVKPLPADVSTAITLYTAIMCVFASTLGVLIIKNISRYPGVEESTYVIPSLCISYGVLIAILIMLRIPYSRFLLTLAFLGTVFALLIIHAFLRRHTKLRIGLVPEGDHTSLDEIANIDWLILGNPKHKLDDLDAVSADLRNDDMSDEWERKLATAALAGVPVYDTKHLKESLTGKVQIERLSENNLGTLSPLHAYMTVKHLLDWIAALVALIALAPALIVVALLIRVDSRGPAIFRQARVGYRGHSFQVYKFRTMTVAPAVATDGDSARTAAMTKDADQRITRLGQILRKTRIDELPQILNILRGEMSWIGPRPEAEVLSLWYENEIPFYRYRHIVRPGITGWAQVNQGHVADVEDVKEKLHFDFYYIKNFSPWIDFIIIGRTIRTMATGFGSK